MNTEYCLGTNDAAPYLYIELEVNISTLHCFQYPYSVANINTKSSRFFLLLIWFNDWLCKITELLKTFIEPYLNNYCICSQTYAPTPLSSSNSVLTITGEKNFGGGGLLKNKCLLTEWAHYKPNPRRRRCHIIHQPNWIASYWLGLEWEATGWNLISDNVDNTRSDQKN